MDAMLIFPRKWFVPPDKGGARPVRDEIDALCQNINGPSISQNPVYFSHKCADTFNISSGNNAVQTRDASSKVDLLPSVDLQVLKDTYVMTMELPGVPPENVSIQVHDNCLYVSGEKRREKRKNAENLVSECVYGNFRRMWTLPDDAEARAISAIHRNGVLTIVVPREPRVLPAPYGNLLDN